MINANHNIAEVFGNQCDSDNGFTKKGRLLQSWYRYQILQQPECGYGPDANSKTRHGNMLINGSQPDRNNFLLPEIFDYAKYRIQFRKFGETFDVYRLFNNMLSSQPMCFNLFFPLKSLFEQDYERASKIVATCFPDLQIEKVLGIEIEFLPYPINEYLNDRTAFDAMILYKSKLGKRGIIAIETKYVEALGSNKSGDTSEQEQLVKTCPYFKKEAHPISKVGFSQLGRNFLLAERYRIVNRLDDVFAVVISPKENNSSKKEIEDFHLLMNEEYKGKLFYLSLEDCVYRIEKTCPRYLLPWINSFKTRYLGFENIIKYL